MSSQPEWTLIAQLGDANPFDYGGYFIYRDRTGVYTEQAEYVVVDDEDSRKPRFTVYRFDLDRCTLTDGVLSDNPYHPTSNAWFASPEKRMTERPQDTTYLSRMGTTMDKTVDEYHQAFCSADPLERAQAYRDVGEYHGFDNLDEYPLTGLSRAEVKKRYSDKIGEKRVNF